MAFRVSTKKDVYKRQLDAQPDEDGYVNIDLEEVVAYIVKEAKKDEIGEYLSLIHI